MHCGVLCDKSGKVKRTWAMVNDVAIVPAEDGDHVIEWECDHGETTIDPTEKEACTQAAIKEQARIIALNTHDDVLAHGKQRGHSMTIQKINVATPTSEPIYYGAGKGLHHRTRDTEGDVREHAVHRANTLQAIDHQPPPKPNAKSERSADD